MVGKAIRVGGLWLCCGLLTLLAGCELEELSSGTGPGRDLIQGYDDAVLKQSRASDVLRHLETYRGMLGAEGRSGGRLQQDRGVVALSGQSPNRHRRWFALFVFDEGTQTVRRKYRFYLDENDSGAAPGGPSPSGGGLLFEGSLVLSHDFGGPRRTAYDRDIAILRYIASRLYFDCKKLSDGAGAPGPKENILTTSGLLMHQVISAALMEMERSPHLAAALATEEGLAFQHHSLDQGRAYLKIEGDIVRVRVEIGLGAPKAESSGELARMLKSLL